MTAWLELKNIRRSFGSIHALKGVDLEVNPGEVIGLVGENGAGKSTLMKIMSGFDNGFEGVLAVDGIATKLGSPKNAQLIGIAIAQQELSLIPTLSIAENIFLGGDHGPIFASKKKLAQLAKNYLEEVGLGHLSPLTYVQRLSIGERHLVEVARLIAHQPKVLILDEPTAALGESDSQRILAMVKRLKKQGKSIIYVSHRLDEIFAITDRCLVLRDGRSEASVNTQDLNTHKLVSLMLGRELTSMFPQKKANPKKQLRYEIKDLWPDRILEPISFKIYQGEILGLAGQLGSGSGDVLAALAGSHPIKSGMIYDVKNDQEFMPKNASSAIKKAIAYCSPDRKYDGLFLGRPIFENLSSPNLSSIARLGFLSNQFEKSQTKQIAQSFTIDKGRLNHEASVLSGGNQQKVALGKWLSIQPNLILVDEPTRGVDVGARAEIYQKIRDLADQGASIIIASTDLLEIGNLPDRVITFYKGAISGEMLGDQISSNKILELITHPKQIQLSAYQG